ncbi:hypothetical protein F5884DRAFT_26856 [Xylogone sp. PMI_703]|nr:hypothetical protein F5884DRAFT_26856 [Xylogone sp. PMI_703]
MGMADSGNSTILASNFIIFFLLQTPPGCRIFACAAPSICRIHPRTNRGAMLRRTRPPKSACFVAFICEASCFGWAFCSQRRYQQDGIHRPTLGINHATSLTNTQDTKKHQQRRWGTNTSTTGRVGPMCSSALCHVKRPSLCLSFLSSEQTRSLQPAFLRLRDGLSNASTSLSSPLGPKPSFLYPSQQCFIPSSPIKRRNKLNSWSAPILWCPSLPNRR